MENLETTYTQSQKNYFYSIEKEYLQPGLKNKACVRIADYRTIKRY